MNSLVLGISIIWLNLIFLPFNLGYSENLLEIYLLAKQNDPAFLITQQAESLENAKLITARSALLPKVSAYSNNDYLHSRDELGILTNNNEDKGLNYNTYSYGINISQPLFQKAAWTNYNLAKKQTIATLKKHAYTEQQLILRVAEQYFAILAAYDQFETSNAIAKAFKLRLDQIKQKFKTGIATIADLREAEAKLDQIHAKRILDFNSLNNEKEQLTQITGKFISSLNKLKSQIDLKKPNPHDINVWVEKARNNNLNLQAARLELEAAQENIKAATAEHFPTINLVGSIHKLKSQPPKPNKFHNQQFSVNLQVPIFNGLATESKVNLAIIQANIASQELEAAYRSTESYTRMTYNAILTQISQIEALNQSIRSSAVALAAMQTAYEAGTRTMVDLLDAEVHWLSAKQDFIKARYAYLINSLKLKQAIGSLNEKDLAQISSLLLA